MNEFRVCDISGDQNGSSVRLDRTAELISALLKALKAYRLYLPNHPLLREFVSAFHHSLSDYLEDHGDLTLKFGQTRIVVEEETVYEEKSQDDSLAFRLFIHGVREITFHEGIPLHEVTGFLQVLRRTSAPQADADELIASVWEKDLSHVEFIIVEDLFDDEEAAEYEAFLREAGQGPEEVAPRSFPGPASTRPAISAEDRAALPDLLNISMTESEALRLAVKTETERSPKEEVSTLFPDIILHAVSAAKPTDLILLAQRTMETLLAEGDYAAAAALYAELTKPVPLPGPDPMLLLRQGLSTSGFLAALRPTLARAMQVDPAAVTDLLLNLGPGVSGWLADRLAEPETTEAAALLLRRLPPAELAPLLEALPRASLPVAVAISRILGDARVESALPCLRTMLQHPEMQFRREALLAIQKIGTLECFEPILEVLAERSPEISILAARGLQHLPSGPHVRQLIPLVQAKGFSKRSPIERNDILGAIGRSGDAKCEKFLVRLASRSGWFRNQARDGIRAAAVTALAQAPMEHVRQTIETLAGDRSPEVKRAAQLALRKAQASPAQELATPGGLRVSAPGKTGREPGPPPRAAPASRSPEVPSGE